MIKKTKDKKTVTKKSTAGKKTSQKNLVIKKSPNKKNAEKSSSGKKATIKKATIKKAPAKKTQSKKTDKKKVITSAPKFRKEKSGSQTAGKRKTRYTAKELEHFKEILLEERKQILESAMANMKSLVDSESGEYVGDNLTYASHMAEQGSDEIEREKNYMFVQRDEKYLGYIQEAIARIEQGTYGVCIDCIEEPKHLCKTCPLIPKERLELVPITQHCIECKNLRG